MYEEDNIMFWLNVKQYIRTPAILFATAAYFLYLGYVVIQMPHESVPYTFIVCMNQINITFIFFLFISYEFFSKGRRYHIDEVISACGRSGKLVRLSGAFILLPLNVLICAILFLACLWPAAVSGSNADTYFFYLVKVVFIHHFLVYLLGILIGFLVSCIKSRTVGYGVLTFVCWCFGYLLIAPLLSISFEREFLYRIADLLSFMTRKFLSSPNIYYMYSAAAVDVQRVLFWIFLTAVILCVVMSRGKAKWIGIVPGIAMLTCVYLFFQPVSAPGVDIIGGQDSWTSDDTYYIYSGKIDCRDVSQYEKAAFKVNKYSMDLKAGRELTARVEVHIDQKDLQRYDFTLYHGYKISSVVDGHGQKLTFHQKGDYVQVITGKQKVKKIVFYYEGCCERYYSSGQGIFLPAYFEYYPVPGKRQVYMDEYYYTGNTKEGLDYNVDFEVAVNGVSNLYTNLTEVDGRWCGNADGVTILASPFAKEIKSGNSRLIYSSIQYSEEEQKNLIQLFQQFAQKYFQQGDHKMILIPPDINGSFDYYGSDHLMGDLSMLFTDYERFINTGERYPYISEEELMNELDQIE